MLAHNSCRIEFSCLLFESPLNGGKYDEETLAGTEAITTGLGMN